MTGKISRRDLVFTSVSAGLVTKAIGTAQARTPTVRTSVSNPVVVSSSNGFTVKNGGDLNCVETAFERIVNGEDVLDALIAGVNIVELDPTETSVGFGGLPNADGIVQLDSCCMHGPKKQAGGVAALEGVRTPSLVAKAVLENTDHHLIVGRGAQTFARNLGFKIEDDLNTEKSRGLWLNWKRRIDPSRYLDPKKRDSAGYEAGLEMIKEGLIEESEFYGTINCNGVNQKGEICGVTTTSGLAWKIPGRTGDSPILGAGLYVDGDYGAAGSTGRGEANLYGLSSFVVVEELRRGRHPKDAGMEALRRIQNNTIEKRLLNSRGLPNFNVNFYVVNKAGEYAGVAMYSREGKGGQYAVCTEHGAELLEIEALLEGPAT